MSVRGVKVELHRHGLDKPVDLTRYVVGVTDIHGRMPPWGGLDLSLDLAASDWSSLPGPGDWLVLRDAASLAARQIARVIAQPTGIDAAGPRVETQVVTLSAETWADFLQRLIIYAVHRDTVGTMISVIGDYEKILKDIMALGQGDIGFILDRVLRRLANALLPETLTGQRLGDAVRVVFDEESARRFSHRTAEPVRGQHVRFQEGGAVGNVGGVPLLDLLLGTFWHAREMVEFFPSVEPLGGTDSALPGTVDAWSVARATTDGAVGVLAPSLERSPLAANLGAHLALVYRVVPWRVRALSDVVKSENRGTSKHVFGLLAGVADAAGLAGGGAVSRTLFGGPTWPTLRRTDIAPDEVTTFRAQRSDADRINATTCDFYRSGSHHITLSPMIGLPLMDRADVARHGLRLYDPQWFFHDRTTPSLNTHILTVAAQAAQFMLGAERFHTGSVTLNRLRRDIRHGEAVRITLHPSKVMVAYVDRVQHVVSAGPAVEGTTTVFFSRGLYDEALRDVQVEIELPAVVPERSAELLPQSSPGGVVLFDGQPLPIAWDAVKLFTHGDGLKLDVGFDAKRRKLGAVDMAVLHWDGTTSARKTRAVLAQRGYGTHFVIDWDGTIYQLVDMAHTAYHAKGVNARSVGVDLNNPVYQSFDPALVANGQPSRLPALTGWSVNGVAKPPVLAFHEVQLDALRALAAALRVHLGVPLVAPASRGPVGALTTVRSLEGLEPGWYHHAEVDLDRQKWDTCGVWLPSLLAQAGPFPVARSGG